MESWYAKIHPNAQYWLWVAASRGDLDFISLRIPAEYDKTPDVMASAILAYVADHGEPVPTTAIRTDHIGAANATPPAAPPTAP
jgi:hypothetical protein